MKKLNFPLYHELLQADTKDGKKVILEGLEEFREHLGGELTITLIQGIGEGIEVHAMDRDAILYAVESLKTKSLAAKIITHDERDWEKKDLPRAVVLNIVGLCKRHLGNHTPNLLQFAEKNVQGFKSLTQLCLHSPAPHNPLI